PRTYSVSELDTLTKTDFPIAAKPIWRRNSSDVEDGALPRAMDRLRLSVLNNRNELEAFMAREDDWLEHLVFQAYVPGLSDMMYTVGIYADSDHNIRGLFSGKKLRGYPSEVGDCIVGEATSVPEHLIENTKRITKDL